MNATTITTNNNKKHQRPTVGRNSHLAPGLLMHCKAPKLWDDDDDTIITEDVMTITTKASTDDDDVDGNSDYNEEGSYQSRLIFNDSNEIQLLPSRSSQPLDEPSRRHNVSSLDRVISLELLSRCSSHNSSDDSDCGWTLQSTLSKRHPSRSTSKNSVVAPIRTRSGDEYADFFRLRAMEQQRRRH